jgi:hypothetical protein
MKMGIPNKQTMNDVELQQSCVLMKVVMKEMYRSPNPKPCWFLAMDNDLVLIIWQET